MLKLALMKMKNKSKTMLQLIYKAHRLNIQKGIKLSRHFLLEQLNIKNKLSVII